MSLPSLTPVRVPEDSSARVADWLLSRTPELAKATLPATQRVRLVFLTTTVSMVSAPVVTLRYRVPLERTWP